MKKIIIAVGALAALGLAVPAAAQSNWNGNAYHGYSQGSRGMNARIGQLRQRIAYDTQRRIISQRMAYRFSDRLRQLSSFERQYSRGGMSWSVRQGLQQRVEELQRQVLEAEQQGRGEAYDRGDRDGRDGHNDHYRWGDNNYRDGNDGSYGGNSDRQSDDNYSDNGDGRYQSN